jgi:hypothetical protein
MHTLYLVLGGNKLTREALPPSILEFPHPTLFIHLSLDFPFSFNPIVNYTVSPSKQITTENNTISKFAYQPSSIPFFF